MKILLIQLARFGDIILTWPTLRAIRREYPEAEIHLLVRKKFSDVAKGADCGIHVHAFDSAEILENLVFGGHAAAITSIETALNALRAEKFDHVINLSFSPLASELTKSLDDGQVKVAGYSRTSDGFLTLPDQTSRYYYSQVGTGRMNRLHVAALFGAVAGVDLHADDWRLPVKLNQPTRDSILVHVGASHSGKTLNAEDWAYVLDQVAWQTQKSFILLGNANENSIARELYHRLAVRHAGRFENRVGQTTWPDLYELFANAGGFIGGDSSLLHLASHADLPTLYFHTEAVRFWETGPQSSHHMVVPWPTEQMNELQPMIAQLFNETLDPRQLICDRASFIEEQGWRLIEFLYFGITELRPTSLEKEAFFHLREMNDVVLETCSNMRETKDNSVQNEILKRADEVFEKIGELCPEVSPLVRWHQTEKVQIGPGDFATILKSTVHVHQQLGAHLETLLHLNEFAGEKNLNERCDV